MTDGSILFTEAGQITEDNANLFWDNANNRIGIGTNTPGATADITQAAATSGTPIAFRVTGGAHTGLTNAEASDIRFSLGRTVQFTGGAATVAAQRAIRLDAPTYDAASAGFTLTDAAVLYVSGNPAAGSANLTITRPWGVWNAGRTRLDGVVAIGTATPSADLDVVQAVATSGTPMAFQVTGAAHTGLANAEATDVRLNLARTVQFTGGASTIATQRAIRLDAPTYDAASAGVTLTDAAVLYVSGNPTAGSGNITISNPWGLWNVGKTRLDGNVVIGGGDTNIFAGQLKVDIANSGGLGGDVWICNSGANVNGSIARLVLSPDATTDTIANIGIEGIVTDAANDTADLVIKTWGNPTSPVGSWAYAERFRITGNGKTLINSTNSNWGQFEIGNSTSNGEASIAFIAGVTAFGTAAASPTSTNGNTRIFGIGVNGYAYGGNQFTITNLNAAKAIWAIDDAGGINQRPAAKSGTPSTTGAYYNAATATFTDNATAGSGTAAAFTAYTFVAPTLAATNASVTTTDAATLYISAPPTAGTNETITNPWAVWVDSGNVRVDGYLANYQASVGTGQTFGHTIENITDAGAGAQQYSPVLNMRGRGWKTDATAASQPVDFAMQVQPVQGAAAPSGNFIIYSRINAGSWTEVFKVNSDGTNNGITTYGSSTFQRNNVGTNQATSIILYNATAAAAGAQRYSPMLQMTGFGWKTDATAASQEVDFALQTQPVQGTAAPSGDLVIYSRINAGTWIEVCRHGSGGYLEMLEVTAPAAPGANRVRIYTQDNGAGKTQLMAIFPSGAAQQIAIEP